MSCLTKFSYNRKKLEKLLREKNINIIYAVNYHIGSDHKGHNPHIIIYTVDEYLQKIDEFPLFRYNDNRKFTTLEEAEKKIKEQSND